MIFEDFKEILNVVHVSVVYISVIACNIVMYVFSVVGNVAASRCHHCCGVNVAILPPLYVAVIVCKCCVCV